MATFSQGDRLVRFPMKALVTKASGPSGDQSGQPEATTACPSQTKSKAAGASEVAPPVAKVTSAACFKHLGRSAILLRAIAQQARVR